MAQPESIWLGVNESRGFFVAKTNKVDPTTSPIPLTLGEVEVDQTDSPETLFLLVASLLAHPHLTDLTAQEANSLLGLTQLYGRDLRAGLPKPVPEASPLPQWLRLLRDRNPSCPLLVPASQLNADEETTDHE